MALFVNGDLHIISANSTANNASVSINRGDGVFDAPVLPDVVLVGQGESITELLHLGNWAASE